MSKMTKLTVLPLVLVLGGGFTFMASAAGYDCDAKRVTIENQIQHAKKYGNVSEVAGLEKALLELNEHCTNAGLVEKAQKKVAKLERKLNDKQGDIVEVQADLTEAQAKGDSKKVAKYQRKLAEKQADIEEINADLRELRAEVAALQA